MGADIHVFVEVLELGWVESLRPFEIRSYGKFAFLANVRNYSGVPEQKWWCRGWPVPGIVGVSEIWHEDFHSKTWVTLDELLEFDYSQKFEDRRWSEEIMPGVTSGGATCEPGAGKLVTYQEFLGPRFEQDLKVLEAVQDKYGSIRIAYGFDS